MLSQTGTQGVQMVPEGAQKGAAAPLLGPHFGAKSDHKMKNQVFENMHLV